MRRNIEKKTDGSGDNLWSCPDIYLWQKHLTAYKSVLTSQKPAVVSLDSWYHEDLPGFLNQRSPPHMVIAELVKLVSWKLKRGKHRPKLLDLAKSNSDEAVVESSKKAFRILDQIPCAYTKHLEAVSDGPPHETKKRKLEHTSATMFCGKTPTSNSFKLGRYCASEEASENFVTRFGTNIFAAVEELTSLKGIGPAAASAIAAAYRADVVAFMSDEAMCCVNSTRSIRYDMSYFRQYQSNMLRKTLQLNNINENGKLPWTCQRVENSLWSFTHCMESSGKTVYALASASVLTPNTLLGHSEKVSHMIEIQNKALQIGTARFGYLSEFLHEEHLKMLDQQNGLQEKFF